MFFSWWFLLFLASYGFSGAQSNHVAREYRGNQYAAEESYGARSLAERERDAADYGYYRAEEKSGPGLVSGGLDRAIDLMSAAVDGMSNVKRSGYRSQSVADAEDNIMKKLKEAQLYTAMMDKYIEDKAEKQKRGSAAWREQDN